MHSGDFFASLLSVLQKKPTAVETKFEKKEPHSLRVGYIVKV
jgi:hypothetical protein